MADAPELDGLLEFSEETDRDSGRFFVGREAEIGLVGKAAEKWTRSVKSGDAPLGVVLISGAPGAGKTALLGQLLKHPPPTTAALSVPLLRLSSEAELVRSLTDALTKPAGGVAGGLRPSGVTANLGLAKFSWGLSSTPPTTLGDLDRGLSVGGAAAAMLLIDEVQTATPDQVRMLAALHLGATGFPLVPVLAGLSDSSDVLSAGGISRRAATYDLRLDRLHEGEPAEAVRMMLGEYRVRGPEPVQARWCRAIEAISDRWPQHVKTAMTALARELLRADGELERADWERTRDDAAALRTRGYEARRSPHMRRAGTLLARFLEETPLPADEERAIRHLEGLMAGGAAGGMAPGAFFDHLVHQGVLHDPEGTGEYVCPIPSLRDYLIRRGQAGHAEPGDPRP